MWKTCQASTSKSKVMTQHFKALPRPRCERNLAGFIVKLGMLKIEGKNKKGRHAGGLFYFHYTTMIKDFRITNSTPRPTAGQHPAMLSSLSTSLCI
jgi:hypothetical protein